MTGQRAACSVAAKANPVVNAFVSNASSHRRLDFKLTSEAQRHNADAEMTITPLLYPVARVIGTSAAPGGAVPFVRNALLAFFGSLVARGFVDATPCQLPPWFVDCRFRPSLLIVVHAGSGQLLLRVLGFSWLEIPPSVGFAPHPLAPLVLETLLHTHQALGQTQHQERHDSGIRTVGNRPSFGTLGLHANPELQVALRKRRGFSRCPTSGALRSTCVPRSSSSS